MKALLISCIAGIVSLGLIIHHSEQSVMPVYFKATIFVFALAAPILYANFSYIILRKSGYNKLIPLFSTGSLLLILFTQSHWHWPLHIILVLSLVYLPLPARKLIAPVITLALPILLIVLVRDGYRIYGESTFYYPDPKPEEAWIRFDHFEKPDNIALEDGSKISLHPFKLHDSFDFESPDATFSSMSRTPLRQTYFRSKPNAPLLPWEIREHNFYCCNLPHFFPSRLNGTMISDLYHSMNEPPYYHFDIADEAAYLDYIGRLSKTD